MYEIAADEYGVVTTTQARGAGVITGEMSRWYPEGKLIRRGHEVYKLMCWVPAPHDALIEAVVLVGEGGYLWGESILSSHRLALVDLQVITTTTPKRMRRTLPSWVKTVPTPSTERTTSYGGVPSQRVVDATEICRASVVSERLANAVEQVHREGLLTIEEHGRLKEDLSWRDRNGRTADATSTSPSTDSACALVRSPPA